MVPENEEAIPLHYCSNGGGGRTVLQSSFYGNQQVVEGLGITACALEFRPPIILFWYRSGWDAGGCLYCVCSSNTTMDGGCCQIRVGTLPSGSTFSDTAAKGRPVTTRRKHILFVLLPGGLRRGHSRLCCVGWRQFSCSVRLPLWRDFS